MAVDRGAVDRSPDASRRQAPSAVAVCRRWFLLPCSPDPEVGALSCQRPVRAGLLGGAIASPAAVAVGLPRYSSVVHSLLGRPISGICRPAVWRRPEADRRSAYLWRLARRPCALPGLSKIGRFGCCPNQSRCFRGLPALPGSRPPLRGLSLIHPNYNLNGYKGKGKWRKMTK